MTGSNIDGGWIKLLKYFGINGTENEKDNIDRLKTIASIIYEDIIEIYGGRPRINVKGYDDKTYNVQLTIYLVECIIDELLIQEDLSGTFFNMLCKTNKRFLIEPINYNVHQCNKEYEPVAKYIMEKGYGNFLYEILTGFNVDSDIWCNTIELFKVWLDKEPKIFKAKDYILLNDPVTDIIDMTNNSWTLEYILVKNSKVKPNIVYRNVRKIRETNIILVNRLEDLNVNLNNYIYRTLAGIEPEKAIELGINDYINYGLSLYNKLSNIRYLVLKLLKEKIGIVDYKLERDMEKRKYEMDNKLKKNGKEKLVDKTFNIKYDIDIKF